MELRHLRYFVAVAEELNFTRAAERLGIKQPPLSSQIRQLEQELATPLFRRVPKGVELTSAGKLFLVEAHNILEHVARAQTDVRRRGRGETGHISIGTAGATYFEPLVTCITREFCAKFPRVLSHSEESSTLMLLAKVQAGKLDAAFVWSPVAEHENLAVIAVAEEKLVIIVPEGHALDEPGPLPLAALANERIFLFARRMNVPVYDSIMEACHRAGFRPDLGRELPHIFAAFPMVAARLGIAFLPECLTRVHVDGVSFRRLENDAPRIRLSLVYRRNDNSPPVRNLISLVRRMARPSAPVKRLIQGATG